MARPSTVAGIPSFGITGPGNNSNGPRGEVWVIDKDGKVMDRREIGCFCEMQGSRSQRKSTRRVGAGNHGEAKQGKGVDTRPGKWLGRPARF